MNPDVVWLCLAIGLVAAVAVSKPTKQMVGGLLQRDRKGRLTLVLTPVKKPRKSRRGRRRR